MKKHLSLIVAICISLASFATVKPMAWDKPLQKEKAFTDPYPTNWTAWIHGTFNTPGYAVKIKVDFNQTVGVPHYVLLDMFGIWDTPGVGSTRQFEILLSGAQHTKTITVPMSSWQEAYVGTLQLLEYGPQ